MTTRSEKRKLWQHRIAVQMASGKNMLAWCKENNVSYTLFLYWHKKLRKELQEDSSFIDIGGTLRVVVKQGFDMLELTKLLRAVKDAGLGCSNAPNSLPPQMADTGSSEPQPSNGATPMAAHDVPLMAAAIDASGFPRKKKKTWIRRPTKIGFCRMGT